MLRFLLLGEFDYLQKLKNEIVKKVVSIRN